MKPIKCQECPRYISQGVAKFSMTRFGKYLCIGCQRKEREKTMPPKLAKFINNSIKY